MPDCLYVVTSRTASYSGSGVRNIRIDEAKYMLRQLMNDSSSSSCRNDLTTGTRCANLQCAESVSLAHGPGMPVSLRPIIIKVCARRRRVQWLLQVPSVRPTLDLHRLAGPNTRTRPASSLPFRNACSYFARPTETHFGGCLRRRCEARRRDGRKSQRARPPPGRYGWRALGSPLNLLLTLDPGLERTDNGMKQTSWPDVTPINQKNYYT